MTDLLRTLSGASGCLHAAEMIGLFLRIMLSLTSTEVNSESAVPASFALPVRLVSSTGPLVCNKALRIIDKPRPCRLLRPTSCRSVTGLLSSVFQVPSAPRMSLLTDYITTPRAK